MAETLADLEVRVGWNDARLRQGANRSAQEFNRAASSIEARARAMDARLATTGNRFGGGFAQRMQQVGFQVGDFATQVAGGTNAITAMTQQGTQLLGAFGPWGAVIGAAGAVVGALAVSLLDAEDASESLEDAMSGLADAGSSVDDLNARIAESSGAVREALIKERDATLALLKARLSLAKSRISEENAAIDERANQLAFQRAMASGVADPSDLYVELSRITARNELLQGDPELNARIAGLQSQIAIAEAGLAQIEAGAGADGSPVFSPGRSGSSRTRSGGGGRSRAPDDRFDNAVQKVRERVQALELERQQIGMTERASEELRAAFDREKLERELIQAAQKDGKRASEDEIALARSLASEVETLTIAVFDEKRAIEAANDAAKQAQREQEELGRAISQTADKFIQGVQNADSFADALRNVGFALLDLALNAAVGQGPLGGLFNDLLGVAAGGLVGLLAPPPIIPVTGPDLSIGGLYAKGGVFSGGSEITAFASGGVINGATTFPMTNGLGLMGEAGPEAIIPLARGKDGKLGVQASGGGGGGSAQPVVHYYQLTGVSSAEMEAFVSRKIAESNRRAPQTVVDRSQRGY